MPKFGDYDDMADGDLVDTDTTLVKTASGTKEVAMSVVKTYTGGGGGVVQVDVLNTSIGTISGYSSDFSWFEVADVGRALVARIIVTPSVASGSYWDLQVRDSNAATPSGSNGTLWLQANGIEGVYDSSVPWYFGYAGSAWVGIRNLGPDRSFTLTRLLYERFS